MNESIPRDQLVGTPTSARQAATPFNVVMTVVSLAERSCEAKSSYCSSGSGGAESFSSGSSGPLLSRTSVSSNSVTVITPGTASSITSTTTVSTAGVLGGFTGLALFRATFFTRPRLSLAPAKRFLGVGLATARFTDLPRTDLEALRVLRCVVAFRFRPVALFFP